MLAYIIVKITFKVDPFRPLPLHPNFLLYYFMPILTISLPNI